MKIQTLSLLLTAMALQQTQATLLVYDGFSGYTVDSSVVGQGPAKSGFTGDWINTGGLLAATVNFNPRATNLSYSNYAPSVGGSLEAFRSSGGHSGSAKQVSRDFTYTAHGSNEFFISFLIQNDSTAAAANTRLWLQAEATANADRDSFFDINHSTNQLTFSAGGGAGMTYTQGLNAGANLVVVRSVYDNGINTAGNPNQAFYDVTQIWINPTINANTTPTLSDLGAANATGFGIMRSFGGSGIAFSYDSLNFRHSLNSGSVKVDEFVMTQSISDIIAIPEPGTFALVGIALGSLLLFRRRK